MGNHTDPSIIRIGYVLTSIWEGGLERFVLTLANELPRDRYEVFVYALLKDNPWIDRFHAAGIRTRVLDARNRSPLRGLPHNALALARLSRMLAADRVDIVHTPDFYPGFMGRIASMLARVPARVHTLHSVYDWYPPFVFPIQRLLGHKTDVVTGVSRAALEFSRTRERHSEHKYQLIPNGADANRFRPDPVRRNTFRAELGWAPDDIVVGSVGARTPRKGHPLLAQAIAPLMRQDPRVRLAVLGPHGGAADTCAEVAALLGPELAPRLHHLAPRSDVENAFSAFDIHCMPSEVEGLSFASIEGMLSGCISVFSDLPAFREVSDDGASALLYRRGDAQALRNALTNAIAMLPAREEWTSHVRERTLASFGQSEMVASYRELYERLARKSVPSTAR